MRRNIAVALAALSTACAVHMRPAPHIRAAGPVERGRYLFENLMDCGGCHKADGSGAPLPPEKDLPKGVVAPNITPDPETGIGHWTDGEKMRAIREGIRAMASRCSPQCRTRITGT